MGVSPKKRELRLNQYHMDPFNQEHIEAKQREVDDEKIKIVESLPEDEQKKFEAVEKAVQVLLDAKVDFYLLPYLPVNVSNFDKFNAVWQWNSLPATTKYDTSGKITDESAKFIMEFHSAFFYSIFKTFMGRNNFEGLTREEILANFAEFIGFCIDRFLNYQNQFRK